MLLVFLLGAVLNIIAFFVAVIALDLGNISLVETILIFPLWSFLLDFFHLSSNGLEGISLRGVRLKDVLFTYGGASFSISSPSLI